MSDTDPDLQKPLLKMFSNDILKVLKSLNNSRRLVILKTIADKYCNLCGEETFNGQCDCERTGS